MAILHARLVLFQQQTSRILEIQRILSQTRDSLDIDALGIKIYTINGYTT